MAPEPFSLKPEEASAAASSLQQCATLIIDFLQSKCLFSVERAFRLELMLTADRSLGKEDGSKMVQQNLWTSRLENMLGVVIPLSNSVNDHNCNAIRDLTPTNSRPSQLDSTEENIAAGHCAMSPKDVQSKQKRRPKLFELKPNPKKEDNEVYRKRRSRDPMSRVVFHDAPTREAQKDDSLVRVTLPVLYDPATNGLEDEPELPLVVGSVLIDRYRIVSQIGKGSFSRVIQVKKCPVWTSARDLK